MELHKGSTGISDQFKIEYIGVGEGIEDLQDFDPDRAVKTLFGK